MPRPPVRKAVFPAAGLGTRFLPVTKAQPKEMLPLIDKPTIQYGIEETLASGIEEVILVTGGGKRAITDHFDSSPELMRYLEQRGKEDLLEKVREVDSLTDKLAVVYVQQKRGARAGPRRVDGAASGRGRGLRGAARRRRDPGRGTGAEAADRRSQALRRRDRAGSATCAPRPDQPGRHPRAGPLGRPPAPGSWTWLEKPSLADAPSNLAIFGRYILAPDVMDALDDAKPGAPRERSSSRTPSSAPLTAVTWSRSSSRATTTTPVPCPAIRGPTWRSRFAIQTFGRRCSKWSGSWVSPGELAADRPAPPEPVRVLADARGRPILITSSLGVTRAPNWKQMPWQCKAGDGSTTIGSFATRRTRRTSRSRFRAPSKKWCVTVYQLPDKNILAQDFFPERWRAMARAQDFVRLLNQRNKPEEQGEDRGRR